MASSNRSFAGLAIITLVMISIMSGLGVWQILRLDEKTAILRHVADRIAADPVPLPEQAQWSAIDETRDYLKVSVSGTFRHDQETYVFGVIDKNRRGENVPGFFVMTPLVLDTGAVLLVNRGFVPQDMKDPQKRIAGQIEGRVTLAGLLRLPERKGLFTPEPDREKRVLYARDPAMILSWLGITDAAPFVLDADATGNPGGWPLGGQTIVTVPNNHLQYAITWFSLAGVTLVMFLVYALRRREPAAR